MLVRMLLAMLMLTGPVPVRLCTCAASAPPVVITEELVPGQRQPEVKSCGCGHRAKPGEMPAATPDSARPDGSLEDSGTTGHTHPERHDRDCPAVNPRTVVSEAVLSPDAPTDFGFSLPLLTETPVVVRKVCSPPIAPLGPPSVPLYISLQTLRN